MSRKAGMMSPSAEWCSYYCMTFRWVTKSLVQSLRASAYSGITHVDRTRAMHERVAMLESGSVWHG